MEMKRLNRIAVRKMFPKRKPDTHKGDYGKILLVCGSVGYTGAAALAAMGALRTGAGLVYLTVPGSIYEIEATKLTEPIVMPLLEKEGKVCEESIKQLEQLLPKMDALLIGPGSGQSEEVFRVVQWLLQNFSGPVVLDADGINVLQHHKDILRGRTSPTVITPHEGEFVRLSGSDCADRVKSATELAEDLGAIVLLKGHRAVITDGTTVYKNTTGNPGMAVGGSGDVLAGVITSLLGQGMEPLKAAACGAWLHGAAGDVCSKKLGQYGMLPSDLLRVLPRLIK